MNKIVIEFRFTRNRLLGLLTMFFLAWHPGFLDSETLTLTTYYPAPYGGYVSLLTTGGTAAAPVTTHMARDAGIVSIGANDADNPPGVKMRIRGDLQLGTGTGANDGGFFKSDQNGSFELGNVGSANTPYLDFHGAGATDTDYSARLILNRPYVLSIEGQRPGSNTGDLRVSGVLVDQCDIKSYSNGTVTYCGPNNNANESKNFTLMWHGDSSGKIYATTGLPISGTMLCCRITTYTP